MRLRPAHWPKDAGPIKLTDPDICLARFRDLDEVNRRLTQRVLEAAAEPAHSHALPAVFGGLKIHEFARWSGNDGHVLSKRALELASAVFAWPAAEIVRSWVNVYRAGDSSLAHSHIGCSASIVYLLDGGEENPSDKLSGKLAIVDPRLAECNAGHPGSLIKPIFPNLKPGMMILIPYHIVHCVTPYRGTRPRITIAWDVRRPGGNDPSQIMLPSA